MRRRYRPHRAGGRDGRDGRDGRNRKREWLFGKYHHHNGIGGFDHIFRHQRLVCSCQSDVSGARYRKRVRHTYRTFVVQQ